MTKQRPSVNVGIDVGKATLDVYASLLKPYASNQGTARKTRPTILDTNTPS